MTTGWTSLAGSGEAVHSDQPDPHRYGDAVVIDLSDAVSPRALLEGLPDPVVLGTPIRDDGGSVTDFRLLYMNATARDLQPRAARSIGASFSDVWPETRWAVAHQACLMAVETGRLQRGEVSWTAPHTGRPAGYRYQAAPADADTLLFTAHDISDRLEETRARTASEQRFQAMFDASPAAVVLLDERGRWEMVSPSLARLLGSTTADLTGRCFTDFLAAPDAAMTPVDAATLRAVRDTAAGGHSGGTRATDSDAAVLQRLRTPDGRLLWTRVEISHVPHDAHFVAHVHDITEERRTREELEHDATHDPLTGLPNRRYVIGRLAQAIAGLRRGERFGVLFIDLDDFKEINDRHGHATGDAVLRDVAARLLSAMRPSDVVARFGGDEFVVVCEGLSPDPTTDLLRVADRIQSCLAASLRAEDSDIRAVGSTIGIVVGSEAHTSPEQVLAAADAALYAGKRSGRGERVVYDRARDPGPGPATHAGDGRGGDPAV